MDAFHEALQLLESCGVTIVHGADYASLDEFNDLSKEKQLLVLAGCFQADIKGYLGNLATNPIFSTTSVTLFNSLSRV